jgi:hypothetical protein
MKMDRFGWRRVIVWGVVVAAGIYVLSFVFAFEMLGCPSRTRTHWLGPTPRHNDGAIDIGKVYEWGEEGEADVPSVFTVYRPLCRVWLMANGLRD